MPDSRGRSGEPMKLRQLKPTPNSTRPSVSWLPPSFQNFLPQKPVSAARVTEDRTIIIDTVVKSSMIYFYPPSAPHRTLSVRSLSAFE